MNFLSVLILQDSFQNHLFQKPFLLLKCVFPGLFLLSQHLLQIQKLTKGRIPRTHHNAWHAVEVNV